MAGNVNTSIAGKQSLHHFIFVCFREMVKRGFQRGQGNAYYARNENNEEIVYLRCLCSHSQPYPRRLY